MNVYKASVSISKGISCDALPLFYFVPAKNIVDAINILEKGRFKKYECEPLQVISIELADGTWLMPK